MYIYIYGERERERDMKRERKRERERERERKRERERERERIERECVRKREREREKVRVEGRYLNESSFERPNSSSLESESLEYCNWRLRTSFGANVWTVEFHRKYWVVRNIRHLRTDVFTPWHALYIESRYRCIGRIQCRDAALEFPNFRGYRV